MSKFLIAASFAVFGSASLQAQPIGFPTFLSPALIQYLTLTPEQFSNIARVNGQMQQFFSEKYQRVAQVDQEIRTERNRDVVDPVAIGIR
jgi:hypothetical protein